MMDWTVTTLRRLRPGPPPSLGQKALDKRGRTRALTETERAAQGRLAQHALCREHVRVAGYRQPVCIVRGQSRGAVLREALRLLDEDTRERRRAPRAVVILS
jgi:hypothetical protein